MKLNNRRSRRSGSRLPLILIILIVLVAVAAYRLNLFATGSSSATSKASAVAGTTAPAPAGPSAVPSANPTATLVPAPTATPIPPPMRKASATAPPNVSAISAVAIDETSGAILYEKNSHAQRAPASITKIVTAIVAIERSQPTDMVNAKYDATELVDATLMGLYPEDRISMEDLLYGLMLPSGGDAAMAIANYIAGSESSFAALMNQKAKELGLHDSNFLNAHGLDQKDHYSSAYDMAMIARYGMQNYPLFREIAAAKSHVVNLWRQGEKQSYDIYNLNKLLTIYPGGDGVKIGYTEDAGRTIVGTATLNRHRVYVALMGSEDLWTDTPILLDYAFKNYEWPN